MKVGLPQPDGENTFTAFPFYVYNPISPWSDFKIIPEFSLLIFILIGIKYSPREACDFFKLISQGL